MKALTWGACPAVAQGKQFEGFFVNLAGCLFLFTIGYRIGNNIIRIFYYYFFFYYIFFTKRSRTSSCKVTLNVKHFSMGKNKTDDEVKKKTMAVCSCPVYRKKSIVIKPKYLQTFPSNWMSVSYFYGTCRWRFRRGSQKTIFVYIADLIRSGHTSYF